MEYIVLEVLALKLGRRSVWLALDAGIKEGRFNTEEIRKIRIWTDAHSFPKICVEATVLQDVVVTDDFGQDIEHSLTVIDKDEGSDDEQSDG